MMILKTMNDKRKINISPEEEQEHCKLDLIVQEKDQVAIKQGIWKLSPTHMKIIFKHKGITGKGNDS